MLFLVGNTSAQAGKKRPTQKAKIPTAKEILLPAEYEIHVVPANNLGIVLVNIAPTPTYPLENGSAFAEFFRDQFGVKQNSLLKLLNVKRESPKVVIKFDADDEILTLINTIDLVRVSDKAVVELRALSDDIRLIVSRKVTANDRFPNPLTLIVKMTEQKNLTLNNEEMGKLSDMSALVKFLKDVYRQREDNGVFRENSNEIEKTVFIKVPLTGKADDLIKIARALAEAGADRIGLQVDETVDERLDAELLLPMPGFTPPKTKTLPQKKKALPQKKKPL